MVIREPSLTRLIDYLQAMSRTILGSPDETHVLSFDRGQLERVREAFARSIREGEAKLHHLCGLVAGSFLGPAYELDSVVIGEVEGLGERFTLVQTLSPEELYATTDLDLGNHQLRRLRFLDDQGEWRKSTLVANFVEYQPLEPNRLGIHKIISRIKAEEEIWNKVVDEIFALDQLVQRDKQLRHLSRYVKDLFGMKILVGDGGTVRDLHATLTTWEWTERELSRLGIPYLKETRRLEFLEVKDYLSPHEPKDSGWKAIKSVVRWWDATFEIQVQPLRNYLRERERLSRESHASFKVRRDALREQVAKTIPLYGFYRDLLRWLFLAPLSPAPEFPLVSVELT